MSLTVQVVGLKEANKRLASLSSGLNSNIISAVNTAAGVVEASAKTNCPVDTGTLRGSIHTIPARAKSDGISAYVHTTMEYAACVEFGTGARAVGSYPYKTETPISYSPKEKWVYTPDKGKTFKTGFSRPAHPYLGKALHDNKKNVRAIIQSATNKAVRHV